MLFVEKRSELQRPRLIRDLPIRWIDDRTPDRRPLATERNVLGTLGLRILDAVGDDVAGLHPLPFDVRLSVRRATWLEVRILLRRVPRIDPAGWRRILRRGWSLRGDVGRGCHHDRAREYQGDPSTDGWSDHKRSSDLLGYRRVELVVERVT